MSTSFFDSFTDGEYGEMYVEFDLRAQLIAIRHFLARNKASEDAVAAEITRLGERAKAASGENAEHLVDLWVDEMHGSVFHDGVNSLAAVGMLAPLVEAIFVQLFRHLGRLAEQSPETHLRETLARADLWDPHLFFRKSGREDNLIEGVLQLAEMNGLTERLPADTKQVMTALFTYRNAMLHNGLEWPAERRASFENRNGAAWPKTWFSSSRSGGFPWIFYMTPVFVERCLTFVEEIMSAFGGLIRENMAAPSAAQD